MTTRQLVVFGAVVVALTLALAWMIERRTVLSLRQDLDRWGGSGGEEIPPSGPGEAMRPPNAPLVGWDDDEGEE